MVIEPAKITIIIPFLNEGKEVESTVKSIRKTQDLPVDILLINDHSEDGVDYEAVAKKYGCEYIFNEKRLGVAGSRNLGMICINTPYYLIIDGHMEFYPNFWAKKIVRAIEEDSRAIYCVTCGCLHFDDKPLKPGRTSMAAKIRFATPKRKGFMDILEPEWMKKQPASEIPREVPCLLGAMYAGTKEYYMYIHGLTGLIRYGADEAYLSLKVWLEGGKCKIISDVVIGHKFRKKFPYKVGNQFRVYNKLLIIRTMLPEPWRSEQEKFISTHGSYKAALKLIDENACIFMELERYYSKIFTVDFADILEMNKQAKNISNKNCYDKDKQPAKPKNKNK